MELPKFSLPTWEERFKKPEALSFTERDARELWANPLFQIVRAEIELRSLKHRLIPPASDAQKYKEEIVWIDGLEFALKLFDKAADKILGKNEKKETEQA